MNTMAYASNAAMYEHRGYEQVALAKRRCPIRLDGAYGTGIFGGRLAFAMVCVRCGLRPK